MAAKREHTEKIKPIIILSGPVGAGKTTVARELIKPSMDTISYIEGDRFWSFIAKGAPVHGRIKNFGIIMASMTAAAIPFAVAGYEVILDFSMPPWFLETAMRIVKRREIPLDYVVLRPSLSVCAERAATRAEGIITDYKPYCELYDSFDEAKPHIISDDVCDAAAMAACIRQGLKEGRFRCQSNN